MEQHNVDDEDLDFHPYQVIEFIVRGPKSERKVDILPSSWVVFNKTKVKLEAKFPPPPYNNETVEFLHHLIKKRLPPLENWPLYTIKLIGQAKTYDEGVEKLNHIKNDGSYLYTEDSDFTAEEKAAFLTNKYRARQKQSDLPKLPCIEGRDTSPDSSTNTDSSWEKRELKSLIKSSRVKSKKTKVKPKKTDAKKKKHKVKTIELTSSTELKITDEEENRPKVLQKDKLDNLDSNGNSFSLDLISKVGINGNKEGLNTDLIVNHDGTDSNLLMENELARRSSFSAQTAVSGGGESTETSHQKKLKEPKLCPKESHLRYRQKGSGPSLKGTSHGLQELGKEPNSIHSEKKNKSNNVSSDTQLILATMKGLSVQVQELSDRLDSINSILNTLAAKAGLGFSGGFISEHNLDLPFKEITDFKMFNHKLDEDKFREDFICSLNSLMDKEGVVSKSVLNILKKYFSKELALQFTNIRKATNKFLLKDYRIHQCIIDAVTRSHYSKDGNQQTLEKSAIDGIGAALSYARDWEGGRKEREEAKKKDNVSISTSN